MKNKHTCRGCSKTWETESKTGTAGNYSNECGPCAIIRRTVIFNTMICPAAFTDTDVKRLPKKQLAEAMKWKYNPRGLLFSGDTGTGKTRTAWELLRRVFVHDRPPDLPDRQIAYFSAVRFGNEIVKRYQSETAVTWLESLYTVELLFIDDFGKNKMTERAETDLFGIVDERSMAKLPIIITTNYSSKMLAEALTENRAAPLMRRLREFCEPIQF